MEGGDGVAIRFIFEILDRDYIEKVRQERGYGINPWDDLSKVSYCCSSVRRTSRRAHGSVLSALPTLGEPGMGPNVVQEPFLRCASQSFKRRRKRLVAWI